MIFKMMRERKERKFRHIVDTVLGPAGKRLLPDVCKISWNELGILKKQVEEEKTDGEEAYCLRTEHLQKKIIRGLLRPKGKLTGNYKYDKLL